MLVRNITSMATYAASTRTAVMPMRFQVFPAAQPAFLTADRLSPRQQTNIIVAVETVRDTADVLQKRSDSVLRRWLKLKSIAGAARSAYAKIKPV